MHQANSACPLLPDYLMTSQNLSPADLISSRSPLTQESISDGSELRSFGRAPRVWAGGPTSLSAPLPSPPPASHSHFLQDTALPSWSRRRQLCFGSALGCAHTGGRGAVFITFLRLSVLSTSLTVTITRAVCCVSQQKDTCCFFERCIALIRNT